MTRTIGGNVKLFKNRIPYYLDMVRRNIHENKKNEKVNF